VRRRRRLQDFFPKREKGTWVITSLIDALSFIKNSFGKTPMNSSYFTTYQNKRLGIVQNEKLHKPKEF